MKMGKILIVLSVAMLSGCHARSIINFENMPVTSMPDGSQMSLESVKIAILVGCRNNEWSAKITDKGLIEAEKNVGDNRAKVLIPFSESYYSILYVDSHGLHYSRSTGTIHRSYNSWVKVLRDSIQQEMFQGTPHFTQPSPESIATGTGFAIAPEGYIVTAHHVIKSKNTIAVYLSEDSFVSARVLHNDPVNDLAVLKIENPTPDFLHLAPMRSVATGDRVFTIGFPVISVLGQEPKYTEGVVSSLSGIEEASSFLQITVPVQPGNSGGPLVNEKGEVVGVITASAAILPFIMKSGTLPQNVNWAVKADYLRPAI